MPKGDGVVQPVLGSHTSSYLTLMKCLFLSIRQHCRAVGGIVQTARLGLAHAALAFSMSQQDMPFCMLPLFSLASALCKCTGTCTLQALKYPSFSA